MVSLMHFLLSSNPGRLFHSLRFPAAAPCLPLPHEGHHHSDPRLQIICFAKSAFPLVLGEDKLISLLMFFTLDRFGSKLHGNKTLGRYPSALCRTQWAALFLLGCGPLYPDSCGGCRNEGTFSSRSTETY